MGVVYLGRQPKLDRLVAVKVLRPWTGVDDELLERFLREARAAALTDAAIVPLHEVGAVDDSHYLVMAHMSGGSLRQVIESRRLAPAEAVEVGRRIAGALATAHAAGVLHRDVKPSNILLDARGNPFLGDFGIAQLSGLTRLTRSGASPGTAEYMAPELATGGDPSEAADVYALGATLYECVTGRPPFTGANHVAVAYRASHEEVPPLPDDVPEPLAQTIMRSLVKEPEERFPNAAALETALADAPAEAIAVAPESVPQVSVHRQLGSTPPAADDFRPTLSVADRRPVDAVPKRGRLGRLKAAAHARPLTLGAGALIAVLALATIGSVLLPRLIHPSPPAAHHRVTATAHPTPAPTPAAATTAPGPQRLPAPAPQPATGTGANVAPSSGALRQFIPNGDAGGTWTARNITAYTSPGGVTIAGKPDIVSGSGGTSVFARDIHGSLVQFAANAGGSWTARNISALAQGVTIAGDPAILASGGAVSVFARGTDGALMQFTNA
ncbi:MAG: serine/threonine protein kinase, partial [Actinobacteria bacterium]|nr:serine/threonine protein kinase [Actinomycetota bacterium]